MEIFQISFIITVVLMVSFVKLSTTQELQDEDSSVYMVVTGRTETTTVFEDEGSGSGSGDDVIEFSTTPIGSSSSFSDAVMRFTSASSNATTDLPTHRVTVTESSGSDVTTESDEVEMTDKAISTESSGSDVTTESGESDEMTTEIEQMVTEIVDVVETTYDVTTDSVDAEVTSPSLQLGDGSTTEAVNPSPPVAIVVVPSSVVPVCSSVAVSGINSYSLSSSIVQYTWSVSSTGDVTEIESLLTTVNANDGEASFDLTGSDLSQVGAVCSFTLTVTDENELQHSVTFDIEASSDETFSVGISTTIDTFAADRTDTFQLRSVVTFFEGCDSDTDVPVQFSWSSNSVDVQSALGITSNSALTIPANTLSSGATTIFTLQVCLGSDSSYCATASQTITTTIPEIQAIISGPSTRLVGVSSGDLTFDGSASNDPSDLPGNLRYSWSLEEFVDDNFVEVTLDATGNTNFAELVDATITFNSSLLSAGNVYRLTLTVTKGERAAYQTVTIETTEVETIDVSLTVDSNSLHSDDILIAKCSYTTTDVVIVTWSITSIDDSTMVPLNDSALSVPLQRTTSASGSSIAVLTLAGDVLSPGNSYAIECALTNQTGEDVGLASIDVTVFSKPISCQVSVADYTVLLEITLSTVSCVTSSVFPPLLYAYYYVANDNGDLKQLSLQSADSVVSVVGPRAFEVSNEVTFVAEVCDQVSSCEYFYTTATAHPVVMVTESEFVNFQQTYVTDLASSGDSLSALQNLNSILESVASTDSSSAVDSATVAQLQVNLLAAALSEADGASNVAMVIVDQISGINTTDLGSSAKEDLADTVTSILSDVTSSSDPISSNTLTSILTTTQGLHSQGVDNSKISNVEEQVLKLITRNALTGGVPIEITTADATYAVKKAAPCGEVNVNSATSSSTVDMGDDVCNSYSSWSCGSDTVCLGVSIKTVFYDDGVDYISSSTSTATSLSSPVMKIDLGNDQTEENIVVDGLSSKISLSLPVTSFNADEPYACRYWDDVTDSWSSEGVETFVDSSTGTVQCRTSHLSAFVVVVDDTSSGVTSSSDVTKGNIADADTTTTTTTTENTTENSQATVPTTFFSNPLYATILVVGILFFLLCGMVFIFFCVLYIFQRQQRKAITTSQEIILGEIRTRREIRRSGPTTPRGKVTPEPPADDNGNTTKMAAVPPSHEMEDPKIAWI